ncbi:MAG TPA: hypothetical protein VKE22_21650 [Haliangiales bacterium]|nr:hypothetical protein [Haliangiales bacterium]
MILILWAAVTLGALLAWPVAYWILVPLGRVKLAAFVARLVVPWLSQDREGRAALAGALALHRRRTIDLELVVWLEARLARAEPLGGGGIVAAGLLRAARGDHDGARALLASAAWLPPVWSPAPAAAVAHEWLAADAASRGDWAFVRALSGPRTAAGTFLALVAERRLGGAVSERRMLLWWRLARRREALRPLLHPDAPPSRPPPDPAAAPPYRTAVPADDPVAEALVAHAETLADPTPTGERVRAAARAWDRALVDPALASLAADRAALLGAAPDGLAAFAGTVVDDLARAAIAAGVALDPDGGPASAAAARRLRERLLGDVEAAADAMARRVRDGRSLPVVDEWRELTDLRRRHARAVALGDDLTRHLVFPKVHAAACPLAVAMWNGARHRPVAHAVFVWLLAEAEAAGHATLAAHERRNVACGLTQ